MELLCKKRRVSHFPINFRQQPFADFVRISWQMRQTSGSVRNGDLMKFNEDPTGLEY